MIVKRTSSKQEKQPKKRKPLSCGSSCGTLRVKPDHTDDRNNLIYVALKRRDAKK